MSIYVTLVGMVRLTNLPPVMANCPILEIVVAIDTYVKSPLSKNKKSRSKFIHMSIKTEIRPDLYNNLLLVNVPPLIALSDL